MAAPTFGDFQDLVLRIEDQTTPTVYNKICGLTSRGITKQNNTNTQPVPADCDDESLTDLIATVEDPRGNDVGIWPVDPRGGKRLALLVQ